MPMLSVERGVCLALQSLRNVYAMAIPAGILVGVAAMFIKRVNVKEMGLHIGAAA